MNNLYFLAGLCDCFDDCGICCYGWCCAPCLFGENAEKIDGSNCCAAGCIWCLLSNMGLCCLYHTGKRNTLRQRYGLQEDCNDCVTTACCANCAICQEARELKMRRATAGGKERNNREIFKLEIF